MVPRNSNPGGIDETQAGVRHLSARCLPASEHIGIGLPWSRG